MNTFSSWVENEMNSREWRPADLARKARISKGSLSNILNDMRNPGPDTCLNIARAFKMPPEEVFRQAGLLPSKPEIDPDAEELLFLFQQLVETDRKRLLQTVHAWVEK